MSVVFLLVQCVTSLNVKKKKSISSLHLLLRHYVSDHMMQTICSNLTTCPLQWQHMLPLPQDTLAICLHACAADSEHGTAALPPSLTFVIPQPRPVHAMFSRLPQTVM